MIKVNKNTKPNANAVGAGPVSARNSNGITLVALIITIIVMLILVGVSISIAINGGLFDITKKAARETEDAKNLEQQLANGRVKVGDTWYDSMEDYINDNPSANQGEGGGETPPEEPDTSIKPYDETEKDENANGVLTANATYTSDGKTAMVPRGFKIVEGIEGTKSIADGLVIQDKDGNEFVWIPVEVTSSDKETSIASFYRSEWKNNARSTSLKDSTEFTEPSANGYTGEVEEYAEMVKSVYKNKGFYIGRYEAGSKTERTNKANGTTEMVVKKDQFPYNYVGWGASMTEYDSDIEYESKNQGKGALYLSKNMYEGKDVGVTSNLCYGVQWDAMLDYVKDQKNVTNSSTWGNYKQSDGSYQLKNTGSSNTYSAKNIYDVAGNLWEWTNEARSSAGRVMRGGFYYYDGSNTPASNRSNLTPGECSANVTFRVTLYIK